MSKRESRSFWKTEGASSDCSCKVAYSRATGRIRRSGVYSGSEPKNKLRKTNTAKYASFMDSIFIHDISLTVPVTSHYVRAAAEQFLASVYHHPQSQYIGTKCLMFHVCRSHPIPSPGKIDPVILPPVKYITAERSARARCLRIMQLSSIGFSTASCAGSVLVLHGTHQEQHPWGM